MRARGRQGQMEHVRLWRGMSRAQSLERTSSSHVLIDEDRVSVRVHGDEAGRSRRALVAGGSRSGFGSLERYVGPSPGRGGGFFENF